MSYIILEIRTAKVVIRFEVRSFLSRSYFLSCSHLGNLDPRPSFHFYNGYKGEQLGLVLVVYACVSRSSDSDEWIFSFTFVTFIFVYYRVLEVSSRFIIIGIALS